MTAEEMFFVKREERAGIGFRWLVKMACPFDLPPQTVYLTDCPEMAEQLCEGWRAMVRVSAEPPQPDAIR